MAVLYTVELDGVRHVSVIWTETAILRNITVFGKIYFWYLTFPDAPWLSDAAPVEISLNAFESAMGINSWVIIAYYRTTSYCTSLFLSSSSFFYQTS